LTETLSVLLKGSLGAGHLNLKVTDIKAAQPLDAH
jgi:hypothetical protein